MSIPGETGPVFAKPLEILQTVVVSVRDIKELIRDEKLEHPGVSARRPIPIIRYKSFVLLTLSFSSAILGHRPIFHHRSQLAPPSSQLTLGRLNISFTVKLDLSSQSLSQISRYVSAWISAYVNIKSLTVDCSRHRINDG